MSERADAIERLVDGELTAEEYRELVAALDDEPGSWRRCALAFLEAQALAVDMRGMALSPGCATAAPMSAKSSVNSVSNMVMLLAMAASFLVVFGLGIAAPSLLRLVTQETSGSGNSLAQQPGPSVVPDSAVPEAVGSRLLDEEPRYVGDVQLVFDGGTRLSPEGSRVPIYDVGRDVSSYLSGEPPALAPEMIDLVHQLGFDVRYQQQYLPAPLDDGRQIIVPVDGYQITPVSRRY
jgi:hypothetical protein